MTNNVAFVLYKNIHNMDSVKDMLKSDLKAAVVNPSYIIHPDQLMFAIQKAIYLEGKNQMKTKNVCTEILYSLSPSRSIKDALKTFGVDEAGDRALFILFDKTDDVLPKITDKVKGDMLNLESVNELADMKSIRKLYNIPNHLTEEDDVLNCIVTRMASKDLL